MEEADPPAAAEAASPSSGGCFLERWCSTSAQEEALKRQRGQPNFSQAALASSASVAALLAAGAVETSLVSPPSEDKGISGELLLLSGGVGDLSTSSCSMGFSVSATAAEWVAVEEDDEEGRSPAALFFFFFFFALIAFLSRLSADLFFFFFSHSFPLFPTSPSAKERDGDGVRLASLDLFRPVKEENEFRIRKTGFLLRELYLGC